MRANSGLKLLILLTCILVSGTGAEEPEPGEGATAPPDDLTGWRLCPACDRLNPPVAEYCTYCGAHFDEKFTGPQRRTPFFISAEIPFSARVGWLTGGVGCAYDGGGWSDEFTATPFFIFIPLGGFNDLQIYFRRGELRPYVSLVVGGYDLPEFEGYQDDDFFLTVGAAGGVRYNYDDRGSYLYGGTGPGYRRRGGDSYDARDGAVVIYKTRFTHFFHENFGVTGALHGWNAEIMASGGVAFAL